MREQAPVVGEEPLETFTLLKLHGSMNWYYSGRQNTMGRTSSMRMSPRLEATIRRSKKCAVSVQGTRTR